MFWIDIDIENKTTKPITTNIPKGTILESDDSDLRIQCLVVARDVTVRMPPKSKQTIKVPALCLNEELGGPHNTPGKLTPFSLTGQFYSQADVWNRISRKP